LGSSDEGPPALIVPEKVSSPKISKFECAVLREHNVLGFDVSVDDVSTVQVLECYAELVH